MAAHWQTSLLAAIRSTLAERRFFLPLLAVIGLGALARTLAGPLNHDSAWYLAATARWLDGAVLYRDIIEINPPLAFFLTAPAIELARVTGLFPVTAFVLYVFLLIAISLLLSWRCLRLLFACNAAQRNGVLLAGLVALALIPAGDFGQREHLMVVLTLPYLLLAAARADFARPGLAISVAVGCCAALGFGLKPHFLLIPAAIELYLAWQRRGRWPLLRGETLAFAATLVGYAAVVVLLTPQYIETIVPFGRAVYYAYGAGPLGVLVGIRGGAVVVVLFAACYLFSRRTLPRPLLSDIFLLASLGFLGLYYLQAKGWHYHLLPALMTLLLAAAALLWTLLERMPAEAPRRPVATRRPAVIMAALLPMLLLLDAQVLRGSYQNGFMRQAMPVVRQYAENGSVFVFSAHVTTTYPMVLYAHARAPSRFPALWLLPGLVRNRTEAHDETLQEAIGRFLVEGVVADLRRDPPAVIIVDERDSKNYFGGQAFDYIEYFSRDPRFAALWSNYVPLTRIMDHEVFVRRSDQAGEADGMVTLNRPAPKQGDGGS